MRTQLSRRAFTLLELLVVIAILAILIALLLPAIQAARAAALRNAGMNNIRMLGLSIHNYADAYKKFPPLADQPLLLEQVAGSTAEKSTAQFSWIVKLLPYLEEANIYNQISTQSTKFTEPAFGAGITLPGGDRHVATTDIATLRFPNSDANLFATAEEYKPFSGTDDQGNKYGVAVTNYIALTATHLDLLKKDPTEANGILVPGKKTVIRFGSITDGTSKTFLLCESKEPAYCSWYDAGGTWAVGLPSSVPAPKGVGKKQPVGSEFRAVELIDAKDTPCAINYGPTEDEPNRFYVEKKAWANAGPRSYGPSSNHKGEIALHLFADVAVHAIDNDIDPQLYLNLITRGGADAIERDVLGE